MLEPKAVVSKTEAAFCSSVSADSNAAKQKRLMVMALALLVSALAGVLYHDRDFWFPAVQRAEAAPMLISSDAPRGHSEPIPLLKKTRMSHAALKAAAQNATAVLPLVTADSRTVLPPLEIDVVAGDEHRMAEASNAAMQIDLNDDAGKQTPDPAWGVGDSAAELATDAAERTEISSDTAQVVSHSVTPDYPLLARQMKVEGSVVLLALVSADGTVQELRVLAGPSILAAAARQAVQQWHFKPHYEGANPVETVARVTVNFTISTN